MRALVLAALAIIVAAPVVGDAQPGPLTQPQASLGAQTYEVQTRATLMTPSAQPLDLRLYAPGVTPAVRIGVYVGVQPQLHTPPRALPTELPVIQPMVNMYQLDQRYADLFSPADNTSMICSAASMANAIVFLREKRRPPLSDLAKLSLPPGYTNEDAVRAAFARCRVSRLFGANEIKMLNCARDFLAEGGYLTTLVSRRSLWADVGSDARIAPQPADLREIVRLNRAALLAFGWYTAAQDPATGVWTYTRKGGHFVTLAGYDAARSERIYVSNPLVDYNALGRDRASALVLERVGADVRFEPIGALDYQDQNTAPGQKWQTRDLVGGRLAVLESVVVVGAAPRLRTPLWRFIPRRVEPPRGRVEGRSGRFPGRE